MHARIARPQSDPAPAVAPLDRDEQRDVRERRREEEERVHPPVDAVEEEHPARHDDRRRDERDDTVGQARDEHGDQRHARDCEERRDEPQLHQPAAGVRDRPREEEVERRAAALAEHGPEELADRRAAVKSASVSSSCGGQTVSRAKRKAGDDRRESRDAERHNVSGDADERRANARARPSSLRRRSPWDYPGNGGGTLLA